MGEVARIELASDLVIWQGDVRESLRQLPDKSIQTCVTSPPYFGLRDYSGNKWEGGDPNCSHKPSDTPEKRGIATSTLGGGKATTGHQQEGFKETCPRCGARRADSMVVDWPEVTYRPMTGLPPITVPAWRGAYGLEPTVEMYVAHSVLIRRELWRVLRDDGVQWLNLGDSYNGSGGAGGDYSPGGLKEGQPRYPGRRLDGLKPKDLIGIPWRVAFALQADGWYLRMDNIWNKPNPMPESVTDRPGKAHEYLFLLSKSRTYFYDADAVREPHAEETIRSFGKGRPNARAYGKAEHQDPTGNVASGNWGDTQQAHGQGRFIDPRGRNKRSVWTIATSPFPEAHFATFPPDLPETCILAGSSPQACPTCGAPWERVTGRRCEKCDTFIPTQGKSCPECGYVREWRKGRITKAEMVASDEGIHRHTPRLPGGFTDNGVENGWQPTCACENNDGSGKSVVLDPFNGSGTTGQVALENGRAYIGCELNPEYIEITKRRLRKGQTTLLGQL